MTRTPILATAAAAVALGAAAIAGCGSSSGNHMRGMSMPSGDHSMQGHAMDSHQSMAGMRMQGMAPLAPGADGTAATADGLTLKPSTTTIQPGKRTLWTLRIVDAGGMPVTRFQRDQTKLMHLIVVRDDFTGYQHIHPVLHPDGRFTISITLPEPGRYRAIADFTTGGKRYPLGIDVTAPGPAKAQPIPPPRPASIVDGYTVRFLHDALTAGGEERLTFGVLRGSKPFTALQPYLGAYGHLVALRNPDLAYSHIHPVSDDLGNGTITFDAQFPSAGTYRLFLQFRAEGKVHTAPFTVSVAN